MPDWRQNIGMWANQYNLPKGIDWREDLINIARHLGSPTRLEWRSSIEFIAGNITNQPQQFRYTLFKTGDNNMFLTQDMQIFTVKE